MTTKEPGRGRTEAELDDALMATFPASDPSNNPITGVGSPHSGVASPFRALAFDLDGTLLGPDERVSDRNLAALAAARAAGYALIIASARWYQLAQRVATQVGSSAPVIACSGAQVRRLTDSHDLLDLRLPDPFVDRLIEAVDAHRCVATFVGEERVLVKLEIEGLTPPPESPELQFVQNLSGAGMARPRIALIQGADVNDWIERELVPEFGEEVRFVESISSRGKRMLTITAAGADKGVALAVACAELGIRTAEVVAFGDAENDIEMFRVAGASVAMGQASDHVKEHATHVSAPCVEDGVAVAVERLLALGHAAFA